MENLIFCMIRTTLTKTGGGGWVPLFYRRTG